MKAHEKRLRKAINDSRWFPGDDTGDKCEVFPADASRVLSASAEKDAEIARLTAVLTALAATAVSRDDREQARAAIAPKRATRSRR